MSTWKGFCERVCSRLILWRLWMTLTRSSHGNWKCHFPLCIWWCLLTSDINIIYLGHLWWEANFNRSWQVTFFTFFFFMRILCNITGVRCGCQYNYGATVKHLQCVYLWKTKSEITFIYWKVVRLKAGWERTKINKKRTVSMNQQNTE